MLTIAVKTHLRRISTGVLCLLIGLALAQTPPTAKPGLELPPGSSAQKINEFLITLKPPTNFQALENGNNLKLAMPDIAASGPINISVASTLPRTDAMWLFTLDPRPDSGSPVFFAVTLEPTAQPEMSIAVNLYKTQHVMLVARAGGKYYAVHRQIKIGVQQGKNASK